MPSRCHAKPCPRRVILGGRATETQTPGSAKPTPGPCFSARTHRHGVHHGAWGPARRNAASGWRLSRNMPLCGRGSPLSPLPAMPGRTAVCLLTASQPPFRHRQTPRHGPIQCQPCPSPPCPGHRTPLLGLQGNKAQPPSFPRPACLLGSSTSTCGHGPPWPCLGLWLDFSFVQK